MKLFTKLLLLVLAVSLIPAVLSAQTRKDFNCVQGDKTYYFPFEILQMPGDNTALIKYCCDLADKHHLYSCNAGNFSFTEKRENLLHLSAKYKNEYAAKFFVEERKLTPSVPPYGREGFFPVIVATETGYNPTTSYFLVKTDSDIISEIKPNICATAKKATSPSKDFLNTMKTLCNSKEDQAFFSSTSSFEDAKNKASFVAVFDNKEDIERQVQMLRNSLKLDINALRS